MSTVKACESRAWWLTIYGFVLEFPTKHCGGEHRSDAYSPMKYPAPAKL